MSEFCVSSEEDNTMLYYAYPILVILLWLSAITCIVLVWRVNRDAREAEHRERR